MAERGAEAPGAAGLGASLSGRPATTATTCEQAENRQKANFAAAAIRASGRRHSSSPDNQAIPVDVRKRRSLPPIQNSLIHQFQATARAELTPSFWLKRNLMPPSKAKPMPREKSLIELKANQLRQSLGPTAAR